MKNRTAQIPQPRPLPILGNLNVLDIEAPVQSLIKTADQFGEIFKIELPQEELIVISSQALVNEVCDEKRFDKKVLRPLEELREVAGDGLFTAYTHEPNWEKAHRILMPAFGPAAIRNMFPEMLDLTEQMMLKLERLDDDHLIDVVDITTRLTLDTIALCAFDYRFNSFYQEKMHPFVNAMVESLVESNKRVNRLDIQQKLMFLTKRRYQANIDYMNKLADELISRRKKNSVRGKKDLLELMLNSKDPVTGEGLSEENIRFQLITFLVAGHETTSGMLSFAIHLLLKNPEVLRKAQEEVDQVLGNRMPVVQDIPKLKYMDQLLKETLRLHPTAPLFAVQAYEDTVIGGKYAIKKGQPIIVLSGKLHMEEKVWGKDAESFRPERFAPAAYSELPPNCWKPFGNGQRACIGRPFAMQEAILTMAMLLQRFDISPADPDYQLLIKETLTVKPEGLYMKVKKRPEKKISYSPQGKKPMQSAQSPQTVSPSHADNIPLLVLYGSNSGSSESFAQRIASDAPANGFSPALHTLNAYTNRLPKEGAVIIVTASYEGKPTDNAKRFTEWLDTLEGQTLEGVKYIVFGCGNKDWVRTYQAIPRQIDEQLFRAGATRLAERGEADARGDFFGDFDSWYEKLWPTLNNSFGKKRKTSSPTDLYEVEMISDARTTFLRQPDLQTGTVVENRELVNMNHPLGRSKRHIEIAISQGMKYKTGDYLAVLPSNPQANVKRILQRLHLSYDAQVIIHKKTDTITYLPTGFPLTAGEIFTNYVELAQPATRKQVKQLAASCPCPPEKFKLMTLAGEKTYEEEVLKKRISLLDLLERFPACDLPLNTILEMLPPLKPRQYSISSSPLGKPNHLTLTVSVLNAPALSGQGQHMGVASNYLAYAQPSSQLSIGIRPSNIGFHPPEDPEIPIIMVCAGSGIAPFRGFLEERALQQAKGEKIGEALLFFGCDHPEVDLLYKNELQKWEAAGVVKVFPAYTYLPEGEIKYVQHRLWKERSEITRLFNNNARIFVCGDGKYMAPAVRDTFIKIYQKKNQCSMEEAEVWANELEKEGVRYVTDVFG